MNIDFLNAYISCHYHSASHNVSRTYESMWYSPTFSVSNLTGFLNVHELSARSLVYLMLSEMINSAVSDHSLHSHVEIRPSGRRYEMQKLSKK